MTTTTCNNDHTVEAPWEAVQYGVLRRPPRVSSLEQLSEVFATSDLLMDDERLVLGEII